MIKINKKSKRFLILSLILLLVVVGIGAFAYTKKGKNQETTNTAAQTGESKINLDPPSDEDKQDVQNNKQRIIERSEELENKRANASSGKQAVTPVITGAEQYGQVVEVSAFVPSVFEDGECTATFTRNNLSLSKKVGAVKEGRAVYCPLFSVTASEFPEKGSWSVAVRYVSPLSEGTSAERGNINVN